MILSFRTDGPGQTVQTQIRLRSSLIRVYTVCHSVCIVWTHYSMVEPHSSNFRVITTNFLGVRIFRKFTVWLCGKITLFNFWDNYSIRLSHFMRKAVLCHMRTTKAQISLCSLIRAFVVRSLDSSKGFFLQFWGLLKNFNLNLSLNSTIFKILQRQKLRNPLNKNWRIYGTRSPASCLPYFKVAVKYQQMLHRSMLPRRWM